MARIDTVIASLFEEAALEAIIQSNLAPMLRLHTGRKALLRRSLTTEQVSVLVEEILPPELKERFAHDGSTRFTYSSPKGTVQVRFDRWADRARLSLVPDGETENGLAELITGPSAPTPVQADGPAVLLPENYFAAPEAEVPEKPQPVAVAAIIPDPPVPQQEEPAPTLELGEVSPDIAMAELLATMVRTGASDLHLTSGAPPMFRIDGDIRPAAEAKALTADWLRQLIYSIIPERNREQYEQRHDTDFAHETSSARFRVNVFRDRHGPGAVVRQIPNELRTAEQLGLSPALLDLCSLRKGLVLVTGPTGSGKSTTLAAMIDYVNRTREDHIITIEDPIEFVHPHKRCLVNQREIGPHTESFKQALRAALREDPDVLLVGELRDLETTSIAIETAETGHLVFATLHTNTAASTIDRIINQYPADRQEQVRMMLSESLRAVVSQTLCKRKGGGRVAAQEILLSTNGVSNLIREGKTFQIPSLMQTGRAAGMTTLNDALIDLVAKDLIAPEEALNKAPNRAEFRAHLTRAGLAKPPSAETAPLPTQVAAAA